MKDPNDTSTIDALDLPRRGRPKSPISKSRAQIQKEYRERKKALAAKLSVPGRDPVTGEEVYRECVYFLNASDRSIILQALRQSFLVPGKGYTNVKAQQADHKITMGTGFFVDELDLPSKGGR